MKLEIAKMLVHYSEEELELREEYSGRGMFGESTVGVVGLQEAFYDALAEAIVGEANIPSARGELGDMLKSLRTDSMGLQRIFY